MPIDRPDWSFTPTEQPSTALVPAASTEPTERQVTRPDWGPGASASAQRPDGQRSSDETVDLDEEDTARYRQLLADRTFTPEELARHYGLTDQELAALTKPATPRQTVEAEIASIERRLREDRRGYFKDEPAQARYRELLEQRANLPARAKAAKREPSDATVNLEAINKELATIDKLRRDNRVAYSRDNALQQRELELIEARQQATDLIRQGEQVQTTVQAVLDEVDDPEAFEAGFDAVYSSLPEHARLAIRAEFARPPESPARPASEADVKRFASTEEGAEMARAWGKKAPTKVAIVRARLERMLSAGDMDRAARWLDELPAKHAAAVLRALAG